MKSQGTDSQAEDFDLFALGALLWRERWLVIGLSVLSVAVGTAYALLATEKFRAQVVLTSAGQRSVPSSLAQLGGLAALAGVSIGSSNNSVPIAVLKSQTLAREFIDSEKIQNLLLEGERGSDLDIRDAVKIFDEDVRSVYEDKRTGIVTLTIEWTDPVVAAAWANRLVERLNDVIRRQALSEAERNITYLRREMLATDVVSQQQSIGRVLEAEMQKLMLARGNDEFAFKIVDRATPPKKRSSPRRTMIVLISGALGFLSSVLFLIGRRALIARAELSH